MAKREKKAKAKQFVNEEEDFHVRSVDSAVEEFMTGYGYYTLENRAIPSVEDGMMPVQRRIIWGAKSLGLKSNSAYVKHARLIGEVMGCYHPHGDSSIYGAGVRLVSGTPAPLLDGSGGWGSYNSSASAMRYHECRITKLTENILLDPYYLRAVETIPNFDGSRQEPIFLPAKLPMVLAIEQQGMALGITTHIPAFTIESLTKVTRHILKTGETVSPKFLLKHLQFASTYGGKVISSEEDILEFYRTGTGPIEWECDYTFDGDTVIVHGIPPSFNFDNRLENIAGIDGVASAFDQGDKKHPVRMVIKLKRGDEDTKERVFEKILKQLRVRITYRLNVIRRELDDSETKFMPSVKSELLSLSVPELLDEWLDWRLNYLEERALQEEDRILAEELARQKLMALAIDHLDIIFKLLKNEKDDLDGKLAKALKITLEEAKTILAVAVRQLGRLSHGNIKKQIAEINEKRKQIRIDLKNLGASALRRSGI